MILIGQVSFLSYTPIGHLEINFLIYSLSKTMLFVPMRGGIANAMRASGRLLLWIRTRAEKNK